MRRTSDMIEDFNRAFGRPVNDSVTALTVTERELLGKLLFEETVEYITKGLGLKIGLDPDGVFDFGDVAPLLTLELSEGQQLDVIECADGLADVNVVIHFCALWQGMNLDKLTEAVNDSNMSKLAEDGTPIINGVTPGYRTMETSPNWRAESGFDPAKPIGKILKGPNFYEPREEIVRILNEGRK